ncbi:MAG: Cof-type HAD-IIB family hydrolase [Microthrixaceae bacterium]
MPTDVDSPAAPRPVRLLLSDVDGTLITPDRRLTAATVQAAGALRSAGVRLALTSGRPPIGMSALAAALDLDTPMGAFNGGVIADRELRVLHQRVLAPDLVTEVLRRMSAHGLDTWLYRGTEWFVPDGGAPHVARETVTCGFGPEVVRSLDTVLAEGEGIAKVTGVSDDPGRMAAALAAVRDDLGDEVAASCSQPYYLDVTHPAANKGMALRWMAAHFGLDEEEVAAIGDMPNDVLMFSRAGLSIAMGNASTEVQRSARRVTRANDDDGWAHAVERFVLPAAAGRPAP